MEYSYLKDWHDPIYKRITESELGLSAGHTSGLVPVAETQDYFGIPRGTESHLKKKKIIIDFWFEGESKTLTTNVNYHRTRTHNHPHITGNLMPAYKAAGAVAGDIIVFWKSKADENYFRAELIKNGTVKATSVGSEKGGVTNLPPPPWGTSAEIGDDYNFISQVQDDVIESDFPTEKRRGRSQQGARLITLRNKAKGDFALKQQDYKCQANLAHVSFITRAGKPYMEKHHLISMKFYEEYENDLDDINNIVSLCPNCHRQIHLGEKDGVTGIIEILYGKQKDLLTRAGLDVSLADLKKKYGV